jgi:hypothetical protein
VIRWRGSFHRGFAALVDDPSVHHQGWQRAVVRGISLASDLWIAEVGVLLGVEPVAFLKQLIVLLGHKRTF